MFRRNRADGLAGRGLRRSGQAFSTLLPSADPTLHFAAEVTYDWQRHDGAESLLHGDAVARALLRDVAAAATVRFPVLLPGDAQAAANSDLSEPIRTDPRLVVTGRVAVTVSEETTAAAGRRVEAAQRERVKAAAVTSRLEVLRELLLDRRLGLVWWVDAYANLQFAVGDPATKTESVIRAFQFLTDELRIDAARSQPDANTVIRARVEELLSTLDDPATGKRAADLLETILQTFAPQRSGEAVEPERANGAPPP